MASKKLNLVLFGPPGIGKGTQSELLVKNKDMVHVSTGNILREHIADSTSVGIRVKNRLESGEYVSDKVVLKLVDLFIDENEDYIVESNGLVFDGFPRTFTQAEGLSDIMGSRNMQLGLAIFLNLEHKVLLDRLTGRRCCVDCGAVFHLNSVTDKKVCSICSGELYKRPDDDREVVSTRLDKYEAETLPLKKYYKDMGIYRDLSAKGDVKEVSNRINSLIDEILLA